LGFFIKNLKKIFASSDSQEEAKKLYDDIKQSKWELNAVNKTIKYFRVRGEDGIADVLEGLVIDIKKTKKDTLKILKEWVDEEDPWANT
jgi:CHASE3 domain sensor protein